MKRKILYTVFTCLLLAFTVQLLSGCTLFSGKLKPEYETEKISAAVGQEVKIEIKLGKIKEESSLCATILNTDGSVPECEVSAVFENESASESNPLTLRVEEAGNYILSIVHKVDEENSYTLEIPMEILNEPFIIKDEFEIYDSKGETVDEYYNSEIYLSVGDTVTVVPSCDRPQTDITTLTYESTDPEILEHIEKNKFRVVGIGQVSVKVSGRFAEEGAEYSVRCGMLDTSHEFNPSLVSIDQRLIEEYGFGGKCTKTQLSSVDTLVINGSQQPVNYSSLSALTGLASLSLQAISEIDELTFENMKYLASISLDSTLLNTLTVKNSPGCDILIKLNNSYHIRNATFESVNSVVFEYGQKINDTTRCNLKISNVPSCVLPDSCKFNSLSLTGTAIANQVSLDTSAFKLDAVEFTAKDVEALPIDFNHESLSVLSLDNCSHADSFTGTENLSSLSLKNMNFSGNGFIISSVGDNISSVILSNVTVSSTEAVGWVWDLRDRESLQTLKISDFYGAVEIYATVSGTAEFERITDTVIIDISSKSGGGRTDIKINDLPALQKLSLYGTKSVAIEGVPNLKYLSSKVSEQGGAFSAESMPYLEVLIIASSSYESVNTQNLSSLKYLKLDYNPYLTAVDITGCEMLFKLYITEAPVKNITLTNQDGYYKYMEFLQITSSSIDYLGFLNTMPNLLVLDAANCNIDQKGVFGLDKLTKLEEFYFGGNPVLSKLDKTEYPDVYNILNNFFANNKYSLKRINIGSDDTVSTGAKNQLIEWVSALTSLSYLQAYNLGLSSDDVDKMIYSSRRNLDFLDIRKNGLASYVNAGLKSDVTIICNSVDEGDGQLGNNIGDGAKLSFYVDEKLMEWGFIE